MFYDGNKKINDYFRKIHDFLTLYAAITLVMFMTL